MKMLIIIIIFNNMSFATIRQSLKRMRDRKIETKFTYFYPIFSLSRIRNFSVV